MILKDENISYLRLNITQLVKIWTSLSVIRKVHGNEIINVFKDVCSDKLKNMLYEFANKKKHTLGFTKDGLQKHQKVFQRLINANKLFEGKNAKHYRNISGSHMQPLPISDHMFQMFGYGGEREWSNLTKGVAACIAMMKIMDDGKHANWWKDVRESIKENKQSELSFEVQSLILDYKISHK